MILSELIYVYKNDMLIQFQLRSIKPIIFLDKQIAIMLSKVCSDIQKNFGIIELSMPISIVSGTDKYSLNQSVMSIKNVTLTSNQSILIEKSTGYIETSPVSSGVPQIYSLYYTTGGVPSIWLYPNPSDSDTVTINYKPNFQFYSVSSVTAGDFGNYGIGTAGTQVGFSGNTVFPTQYDKLILLGLMKEIFPDYEEKYIKESMLLHAKQFNGHSLKTYNMDGVIDAVPSLYVSGLNNNG